LIAGQVETKRAFIQRFGRGWLKAKEFDLIDEVNEIFAANKKKN
jgi:hypothetical protein